MISVKTVKSVGDFFLKIFNSFIMTENDMSYEVFSLIDVLKSVGLKDINLWTKVMYWWGLKH